MKRLLPVVLSFISTVAAGQSGQSLLSPVSTTRVLAVGHLTSAFTADKAREIMPKEVRATVRLYLGGKLEQWYSRQDERGVVFILNVSSTKEADELLEKLPLGEEKLMKFDLIPLGPLAPLQILMKEAQPSK